VYGARSDALTSTALSCLMNLGVHLQEFKRLVQLIAANCIRFWTGVEGYEEFCTTGELFRTESNTALNEAEVKLHKDIGRHVAAGHQVTQHRVARDVQKMRESDV
jgi:hypothetical protein